MNRIWNSIASAARALALALALLIPVVTASAIDKITLKDGNVIEGTIVREVEGIVWIKHTVGGIAQERMVLPGEISAIVRDAAATPASSNPVVTDDPAKKATPRTGVPRAAIITLGSRESGHGDTIGIDIQAHALRQLLPMLEDELGSDGTGVVVFRVTSGGGLLLEIQRLSDVIQEEYKKRFRVVAWIDSAISAAAMTSHCIEEIYFTPQGNYGACTGWSGQLVAVKGRGLEEVLYAMEKISARGGYDPAIMRAMQIQVPLSCTITADGDVKWYRDSTSGEILVNRDNEILTFNSETARKVKFSKGTASTLDELRKLMGYEELEWVGKPVKGYIWPISKSEAWNMNWRKQVHNDQENLNNYFRSYQMQVQAAASEPLETRGKFVNQARESLKKIKDACKRNPNMGLLTFNVFTDEELREIFEREEKRLRDLMR